MANPVLRNVESHQDIHIAKSPFSIGRSLVSDYVITNRIVSRIHCTFEKTDAGWILKDSSTNGTMVNDNMYHKVASHVLQNSDEICLGSPSYTYKFLVPEKYPNLHVERIRNEESLMSLHNVSSPDSPCSFDDNGVSDDILNTLAGDILSKVENELDSCKTPASTAANGAEESEQTKTLAEVCASIQLNKDTVSIQDNHKGNQQEGEDITNIIQQRTISDNILTDPVSTVNSTNLPSTSGISSFSPTDSENQILKNILMVEKPSDQNFNSSTDIPSKISPKPKDNSSKENSRTEHSSVEQKPSDVIVINDVTVTPTALLPVITTTVASLSSGISVQCSAVIPSVPNPTSSILPAQINKNHSIQPINLTSWVPSPSNSNKKLKIMNNPVVSVQALTGASTSSPTANQIIKVTSSTVRVSQNTFNQLLQALPGTSSGITRSGTPMRPKQVLILRNAVPITLPGVGNPGPSMVTTTQSPIIDLTNTQSSSIDMGITSPCNNKNTTTSSTVVSSVNNMELFDSQALPVANHEVVVSDTSPVKVNSASSITIKNLPVKNDDVQKQSVKVEEQKVEPTKSTNQAGLDQNQFEEMENELMCTICANLFIKTVTLGCSHSFCQYCIDTWKKKKLDCPICRKKITSSTRTLVLDNVIEKMLENSSLEDRQQRQEAVDERQKIEDAAKQPKNKQNNGRNVARRGRGRGNNNRGNNNANAPAAAPPPPAPPVMDYVDLYDSPSDTSVDSDDSHRSYYDVDDWDIYYDGEWSNGRPGAYYGGYGRCYKCGDPGHWANGCPNR